jgi:thiamine kinase
MAPFSKQVLARGGMAEIYAWGDDRVLKLFRAGCVKEHVEREVAGARAALAAGIKTPAVIETTTINGRVGIFFERAPGPTMLQELAARPERALALAHQLATLHARVHETSAANLPGQRPWLLERIRRARRLTAELERDLVAALDRMPDDRVLCHGDFHPGNIILSDTGPVVIDWFDATQGHPLADVVQTVLIVRYAAAPATDSAAAPEAALRRSFAAAYLQRYLELHDSGGELLAAWAPLVAAARLAQAGTTAEREALLELARGAPWIEVW